MYCTGTEISCGVDEIQGVGQFTGPGCQVAAFVTAIVADGWNRGSPPAHLVFSDYVDNRVSMKASGRRVKRPYTGRTLAAKLKVYGTIVRSPPRVNRNSKNTIEVFVFTPNAKFRALLKEPNGEESYW